MEENVLHVGLIAGRHPLPVEGYVWKDAIEEPTDFVALENQAANWIHDVVSYDLGTQPADVLYLYVTGLTSALTCSSRSGITSVITWRSSRSHALRS